jgi:tetratricopeptide (TPR) repeat protein
MLPAPVFADAGDDNRDFLAASQAYEAGDWGRAVALYEELMARAGVSAPLCYNLGNSCAQNGQTGKAVLQYERALLLAAGDADSRHNLRKLRQDKGLDQEEVPLPLQAATLLSLNQWTLLAALFLAALALWHLATLRRPVSTRLTATLTSGCLLLLALCIAGMVTQYRNRQQAVVIAESPLLISPFAEAKATDNAKEGSLIRIVKTHGQYALIKDKQGRGGWIPTASFESIAIPTTANKNINQGN